MFLFQVWITLDIKKIPKTPYTNQTASRKPEEKTRHFHTSITIFLTLLKLIPMFKEKKKKKKINLLYSILSKHGHETMPSLVVISFQ